MYSFKELRKAAKTPAPGKARALAILGNCSTQFLAVAVRGFAALEKLPLTVFDAGYNQIEAQVLEDGSELYASAPDSVLIYLATEKLYEEFLDLPPESRGGFAGSVLERLEMYWDAIGRHTSAAILQMNFTELADRALGSFSCRVESTFTYQLRRLNYLLQERMAARSDVYPVDLLSVQAELGRERFFDPALYYNAKMAVSTEALPYVAKAVVDVEAALRGRVKKCLVLDLDNTLWGGVVGDDGPENIEIGELGRGHVFTNFQRWLKELKECGVILAVCSKNDEATAKLPFESHPEMVLRLEDIAVFVANWEDKAGNIRMIQRVLNIGMDSMVFVDDNPFERELVRSMIPEIEVPELPEDPALYLDFLQKQNYFETAAYTGAAADRTKLYQAEQAREKLKASYASLDEYLESLEMVGTARPFEPSRYSRIAQLTQRSNQFNLRTVRYTEADIQRLAEDPNCLTLYYELRDKFGDHGLVGVIVGRRADADTLFIDTWLMSCRVLKRGMEEFIMAMLMDRAKRAGYRRVVGEYIPTPKNGMVKDIYRTMGFEEIGENRYRADTERFRPGKFHIKESEE